MRWLVLTIFTLITFFATVLEAYRTNAPLVLTGLDPVALLEGKELPGDEVLERQYGGHRYRFASEANQALFDADPARFAVAQGGHCAVMPTVAGRVDLFAVHAGKIWLFGSESCRTSFTANPEGYASLDRLTVAIVIFEGVELLDFAGPGEVLAVAGHGRLFEPILVSEDGKPITSLGFAEIVPQTSMKDCPPPDVLVIPGGDVSSLDSEYAREWIAGVAQEAEHVLSVCNGALVLAQLGLLDGLSATTHHSVFDALANYSETIDVRRDTRWVDNGRIVTAAGISSGIDGALHLVAKVGGLDAAQQTARYMEVDWTPGKGTVVAAASD